MDEDSDPVMTPWVSRLERRGLFGRKHVALFVIGRIFFQLGGKADRGWMTMPAALHLVDRRRAS